MKGSPIPSSPARGILNSSAKRFGGVTIEAPFPCLSFPRFPRVSPTRWHKATPTQPGVVAAAWKTPLRAAPASRGCSSVHGIGISRGKKNLDPASPEAPLGAAPSGGMESRILDPLPTIPAWKKSRGTLCFQETAAPPAKKHEPEQSPIIFGLETILPPSPKRHRGGFVTLGLPTSHTELCTPQKSSPNPGNEGWDDAVRTALARRQLPAWPRHRREFLRRGFQRLSINFCTIPPSLPA